MSFVPRLLRRFVSATRHTDLASGTAYSHTIVIPNATYSPWNDDAEFTAAFQTIRHNSLVDIYRAYELWSLVRETSTLGGDILEVGVWRGGTGCLMAKQASLARPAARVFLCDTFKGVVKAGTEDRRYTGGEHADTSMSIVQKLADTMGLGNVELLEGIFPEATGDRIAERRLSVCHIDVDVYESAKQVAEWVWPRLLPGGVIVYDDYGFHTCEGITKLVNQHLQGAAALTIHNLNGHAVIVKC